MKIINPATGELIQEMKDDDSKIIQQKYQRARAAQKDWEKLGLDERIEIIVRFYGLLEERKDELSATLTKEVGKPIQESLNEINGARSRIRYFIENSRKWLSMDFVNQEGTTKEILTFDALGVVCNISAWNYPLLVGVNVFIPALIAGNSVLYKPSECSTLTGLLIEKYLNHAGVPQDVFISVLGGANAGEHLLDRPCDGYFFTGSLKTGKYIAEKVAQKLVPVGLELGGKDPVYITDQVDVMKAAASVAEGCFYNNGQSCCAIERVYVHEKVYDSFMKKFLSLVQAMKTGPVTRGVHLSYLESQVKDAVKKGAVVLSGGGRSGKGNYFEPTVLVNVDHRMNVMKDETFGPVIGIMKVKDDEEAIGLMNDTEYGLTASVYCMDIDRAKSVLSRVDTGTSYINCCDRVSPYLPWAGRKNSGLGATLSYVGIQSFARTRGWHIRDQ